uniref:Uncharacterized protein n=2 Tax=Vitis vinifera TaxID=29760 RepID=A5ASI8_VITVI|nr:hypothetical protein VITISV_030491 [Vitis vinifera]
MGFAVATFGGGQCFWLKALVAIPKVQPRFAIAIWKKYPTMKSLLRVYMDPSKSVHEKEFLLKDLTTEGLLGEDRRLGEAQASPTVTCASWLTLSSCCCYLIKVECTSSLVTRSPQLIKLLIMEKSRSFPDHPYSYSDARHGFELRSNSYSFNGPIGKVDEFATSDNPEMKRRKRVASYNMYSMEGKLKSSLRNSFKWIKNKFTDDYYDDM